MAKGPRLDQWLVDNGLVETREKARALILAGGVLVAGAVATKAGYPVPDGAEVILKEKPHPYVGRGGVKLAGALDRFMIDPKGLTCLDVGSSTGGFTDLLLRRGARKVYAVDVGTNQLDYRLRSDERVVAMEGVNAREFDPDAIPDTIDLLVADVSFISLKLAIPPFIPLLGDNARLVLLVKPQFEAGREEVGKGGIVDDEAVHEKVLNDLIAFFARQRLSCWGAIRSPIEGKKGNREYFLQFEWEHEMACCRIFTVDMNTV